MQRHSRRARQYFGEWLDVTIDNAGAKARVLAEEAGVDDSTVSRWRKGASIPDMAGVYAIARMFQLDWQRVAATAGLELPPGTPVDPYDIPSPTARIDSAKRHIEKIRGLSPEGRDKLLEVYSEIMEGQG